MRNLIAMSAIAFFAVTSSSLAQDLSQAQTEGVEAALKAENCTATDMLIQAEGDGYKVSDVICGDDNTTKHTVILDKDFKIIEKK